ncbi:PDZ domain-containing protein [Pelosinus propionicus]|uniref:PDZ domain (Also known as DHR or GLGF) n=1 Tax=Pelosinus propionicus DSM 13327 TaxID=1123291 RepID=A0A1I4JID3_9FIRM|nr:PDZ domain-containing protein [Pelosinus propionicus]SFL65957.1 PDZ domain (Also known as DHR or GLGF) [Pelosinus propionicus DSM 13327]
MFRKALIILGIVFSCMYTTVFAASHVVINDVETKEVKNYIIEKLALSGSNWIIEQASDNNLVLLATRTQNAGLFGQYTWSYENRLGFAFVQKDKDVILSVSETCTSHAPNGATTITPVGTANTEIPYLQNVKGYFNGMYLFGFNCSSKKENGGFPITDISPFGAFEKEGIRIGDVLIAVNDVKLKKARNSDAIDGLFFDKTRQTTLKFLIKRGEVEKIHSITSEYMPPEFKK